MPEKITQLNGPERWESVFWVGQTGVAHTEALQVSPTARLGSSLKEKVSLLKVAAGVHENSRSQGTWLTQPGPPNSCWWVTPSGNTPLLHPWGGTLKVTSPNPGTILSANVQMQTLKCAVLRPPRWQPQAEPEIQFGSCASSHLHKKHFPNEIKYEMQLRGLPFKKQNKTKPTNYHFKTTGPGPHMEVPKMTPKTATLFQVTPTTTFSRSCHKTVGKGVSQEDQAPCFIVRRAVVKEPY